jgi:hypothetical protein
MIPLAKVVRRKPNPWDDVRDALDEIRRRPVRWFYWGDTVAVVAGMDAFAMGANGWIPVNEAEVTWDGLDISEAEARKAFGEDFWLYGDPPIRSLRPVYRVLTDAEEDEREIEAMVSTLEWRRLNPGVKPKPCNGGG